MLHRAIIKPVPENMNRPLWSVMIPTYNCAAYLRETLTGILSQDPGKSIMQIEVVDDCSTKDDPEQVIKEIGKGRVRFFRQSQNVGHTKNFETCLNRSTGRLIHLLHGDDRIRNGFYSKMQALFEQHHQIGAAFCRHVFMDEDGDWLQISSLETKTGGILNNWLPKIAIKQRILTPSIVVKREVYEHLGGFDDRLSWVEDWEMWVRIAANFTVGYEPEILAEYRSHSSSNTGKYIRTAENMKDLKRAIYIINNYMPEEKKKEILKRSLQKHANYGFNTAMQLSVSKDKEGAKAQLREVLHMNRDFFFFLRVINLYRKLL